MAPSEEHLNSTENPFSLKYIRVLRSFLWFIGAWPGEIFGENVPLGIKYHRKQIPVVHSTIFVGQWIYIKRFSQEMNIFLKGHCYITTILSVLTTVRTSLPSFSGYGVVTKKFLLEFHLVHFKHKGEYYKQMSDIVDKISYYMTTFLVSMVVCAVIMFNAPPWYSNYKMGAFFGDRSQNATLEYSVYYTYPNFDPFEHFIFCTIVNFYLTYNCAISVCGLDLLLSLMMFQIIGHILTLKRDLDSFPKPKSSVEVNFTDKRGKPRSVLTEYYDKGENEQAHRLLIACVNHHRIIVGFTDEVSTFFGPMLGFNYLFHLVSCCLLLLECSKGDPDAILRFGPLTIIVFGQLIQISIVFEVVGAVSESLVDNVYNVPWEYMDTNNRRLVIILLHRVQTPIRVKVMGLADVGVTTMAAILKTTFTYFAFLRSIED